MSWDLLKKLLALFSSSEKTSESKPAFAPVRSMIVEDPVSKKAVSFEIALAHTYGEEGGYAFVSGDTGGETIFGITRRDHPNWEGWVIVESYKPRRLAGKDMRLRRMTRDIYEKRYWNKVGGYGIATQKIANELFDTAVNMGPGTAGRFLQIVLNDLNTTPRNKVIYPEIAEDGKPGPKTLWTLRKFLKHGKEWQILDQLNHLQGARYSKLVRNKKRITIKGKKTTRGKARKKFMWGWQRRARTNSH